MPSAQVALAVPLGLVGADDDLLDALGGQLVGQLRHGQRALGVLRTGHRDDVVVEHLVGDVHAGGDARLHGELAGVEEGAVADVLEDVRRRR